MDGNETATKFEMETSIIAFIETVMAGTGPETNADDCKIGYDKFKETPVLTFLSETKAIPPIAKFGVTKDKTAFPSDSIKKDVELIM